MLVGAAIGYGASFLLKDTMTFNSVRYSGNYRFVSPPLYTEVPESLSFPEYAPLKNELSRAVQDAVNDEDVQDVAVYFRDLNEGRWVGVNQTHTFSAGSLSKVARLMTVLRITKGDQAQLARMLHLTFDNEYVDVPQDYFPPRDPVIHGGTYSVDSLLSHLIIESDNRAAYALGYYFGESELRQTFDDLNVSLPEKPGDEVSSPQNYSHFFRALYNGTYLSPAASEHALDLLSRSNFTDGLIAGTPAGTVVAHKFGEYTLPDGTDELHDCGIVYYPEHPYFLCVMTKGKTFPTLAEVIKTITKITWEQVEKRYQ